MKKDTLIVWNVYEIAYFIDISATRKCNFLWVNYFVIDEDFLFSPLFSLWQGSRPATVVVEWVLQAWHSMNKRQLT